MSRPVTQPGFPPQSGPEGQNEPNVRRATDEQRERPSGDLRASATVGLTERMTRLKTTVRERRLLSPRGGLVRLDWRLTLVLSAIGGALTGLLFQGLFAPEANSAPGIGCITARSNVQAQNGASLGNHNGIRPR